MFYLAIKPISAKTRQKMTQQLRGFNSFTVRFVFHLPLSQTPLEFTLIINITSLNKRVERWPKTLLQQRKNCSSVLHSLTPHSHPLLLRVTQTSEGCNVLHKELSCHNVPLSLPKALEPLGAWVTRVHRGEPHHCHHCRARPVKTRENHARLPCSSTTLPVFTALPGRASSLLSTRDPPPPLLHQHRSTDRNKILTPNPDPSNAPKTPTDINGSLSIEHQLKLHSDGFYVRAHKSNHSI